MSLPDLLSVLAATLRLATPLILASLGGLFSERAGIVALGLEGMMLAGAFAAGSVAALSGSPWPALAAAMGAAILVAAIHGYATVSHRGDQVVSGMALNILATGLTPTLGLAWFDQGGQTPALGPQQRFLPIWGGQSLLVYLTLLLMPLCWWLLYRSRFGLRLRAVGENPHAVEAAGLSVTRLRYLALLLCGALAGLAGADLAIAEGAGFTRDMTAGRGYLALAALIFGKWRPAPAFAACLLFALADALQLRLQGVVLPGIGAVPVQWIEALPYLATLVLLAGFVGRARAPAALGVPFEEEK
ncbi:MAG TPA: ABC transporter permease [Aliidongia sp.]|nr:ABC transporter permease [Aliidongia sp.]